MLAVNSEIVTSSSTDSHVQLFIILIKVTELNYATFPIYKTLKNSNSIKNN